MVTIKELNEHYVRKYQEGSRLNFLPDLTICSKINLQPVKHYRLFSLAERNNNNFTDLLVTASERSLPIRSHVPGAMSLCTIA